MIIDANAIGNLEKLDADICIMGGGVAGIVLAHELLKGKKNVLLIESGNEAYDEKAQELYEAESVPAFFPGTSYSRLRLLGGSSNHWENSIERFDPIDFKKRDWIDNSGWPITYEEVLKFYPEAEAYCGVGNGRYDLPSWKRKFDCKDIFLNSSLFSTVFSVSPPSPTNFYDKYGEGLINSNNIKIIKNANVVGMEFDSERGKVTSILFKTFSGVDHTVRAKRFVMCLGGIENARMLLVFNEKYKNRLGNSFDNVGRYFMEHPTIRAADLLPFGDSVLDKAYSGVDDDQLKIRGAARAKLSESAQIKYHASNLRLYFNRQSKLELSSGISSSHIILDSLKGLSFSDNFGQHLVNVIKDIDQVAEALLRKEFDVSLFESANEFGGYQIVSMIEQTPDRNNRIRLGVDKDRLGIKKIKIDYRVTQEDKDRAWRTLELLSKDPGIQAIGRLRLLKERESQIWGSQLGFGQHHMGTTRMSHSEKTGVVDTSLKVFGTNNLYISGSSVFPTGGHVPPTLTIVAVTIRLARELMSAA